MICCICFAAQLRCEEPQKITVCQLQKDPPAFNHKLVELEAFVSWGFEDFTLFDPACYVYPTIWLEYGGKEKSDTIFCCGPTSGTSRPEDLVVDGVTVPLVEDDLFRRFNTRIHQKGPGGHGPPTRARLVGRFFAGRKETYPSGESAWGGYGHFGCCTLLAIEQIKETRFEKRSDLDLYGVPMPLIAGFKPDPNYYRFLTPDDIGRYDLESQIQAEGGSRSWAFDDPKRVALELIQQDIQGKVVTPSRLRVTSQHTSFIQFEMKLPELGEDYSVAVSRPYWLSFYARDPNRVAWVVISGTVSFSRKRGSSTQPK